MLDSNPQVDLYTAKAKFLSDKVVEITADGDRKELTADVIVINTGSRTNVLNIEGLKESKNVPHTVFITPALSRVGLTEKEAREQGYDVLVKEHLVSNIPRGAVNGDPKGIFKAVVDKNTNLILGTTLFSRNSEELINLITMAMDNNIPYTYIRDQIFNHPNMAENLNDLFNI